MTSSLSICLGFQHAARPVPNPTTWLHDGQGPPPPITVLLKTITSREYSFSICPLSTVEDLRVVIGGVTDAYQATMRLVLGYSAANKARLLVDGWGRSLRELGLVDGSKVFLVGINQTNVPDAERAWAHDLEARARSWGFQVSL